MSEIVVAFAAGIGVAIVTPRLVRLLGVLRPRDRDRQYREAILALFALAQYRSRKDDPSLRETVKVVRSLNRHDPFVVTLVAADLLSALVKHEDDEEGDVALHWAVARERGEALAESMARRDKVKRAGLPWWLRWMK